MEGRGAQDSPAGLGASGAPHVGPSPMWEIVDTGGAPAIWTQEQLVEALLRRSVSMNARVRPQGTGPWQIPEAFADLEPACPSMAFARSGAWPKEASGMVVLSSNRQRLLDVSREVRHESGGGRKPDFILPILNPEPGGTMVTWTQLFAVWDRFYVGCVIESHYVKSGQPLNVFLLGINCADKAQSHALHPASFRPPDNVRSLLGFSLGPFRWQVNHFLLGTPPAPQGYRLEFRTVSTGGKVATAAAVGILTLGTVVYAPGHKGFSATYVVLDPPTVQRVNSIEQGALRSLAKAFDDKKTDHLVGPAGEHIPKERVIEWFRYFLGANPERIVRTVKSEKDASNVIPTLFNRFMNLEFPEGTWFPKPPSSTSSAPPPT